MNALTSGFQKADWRPDTLQIVMITLKAYGDETSDEKCARVFLICAVLGMEDTWLEVEAAWQQVLKGRVFHSREWDDPETFDQLVKIVSDSHLFTVGTWLDIARAKTQVALTPNSSAYYVCFQALAYRVSDVVEELATDFEHRLSVEVTFDHRAPSEAAAGAIYSEVAAHNETVNKVFARKITFDFAKESPRLQIADLVASVIRRDVDRTEERRATPTKHRRLLKKVILDDLYKRIFSTLTEKERKPDQTAYTAWLLATGRFQETKKGKVSFHDTALNRVLFREVRDGGKMPPLRGKRRAQVVRLLRSK